MDGCPYCSCTGFIADETHTPDPISVNQKPDEVRWLNRCSSCGLWSMWARDTGQVQIPDPTDPESVG